MDRTNLDAGETEQTGLLGLEVFVHLVSVVAIDVGFGHQRECDTMVKLAEGGDTGVILRFLAAKLRPCHYQTNPVRR